MRANPPAGVTLPPEADIAKLKRASSTDCRYTLDTATGLALEADCTTTTLSAGPPLSQVSTVARTVIMPTLRGSAHRALAD